MNSKTLLLLILGLFVLSSHFVKSHPGHDHHHGSDDEEEDKDTKVVTLCEDSFMEYVTEHDVVLVKFYAPWCGHCKKLAPEYKKAAEAVSGESKIGIAKVDCTVEEELCSAHKIQGYPTLILYNKGKPEPYEGGRSSKDIIKFVKDELQPPVTIFKAGESLDEFKKANPLALVAHFQNDHDDRFKTFESIISKNKKNIKFAAVIDENHASVASGEIFRNFDEPQVAFEGEWTVEALNDFISLNIVPLVGEINGKTYKKYENLPVPLGYLFINGGDDNTKLIKEVTEVVKSHKSKIIFCTVDMKKFGQQASYMGLSGKVVPALSIESDPNKFVFDEATPFTQENLQAFVDRVLSGKETPFVKSEPLPEKNDGAVKIVVGHNYKDIVLDESKDVFVEFYAPWCGHCKSLAPIYEQLGEYLQSVPSVVVAKVDATANDVPKELNIKGFPTLLLFKANDKANPISYEGLRDSYQSLAKFINDKASVEFELPTPLATPKESETETETDEEEDLVKTIDIKKESTKKDSGANHDEL